MPMTQSTKRVLITGATAGIGLQTALDLLQRGHEVFVTGRRVEALERVQAEAVRRNAPGLCHLITLDVTEQASVDAAVARVDELTANAGVDVLINNAGYATAGPMIELDAATLQAQFDTNVFGLMRVTRAFGARMIERRAGRIINVGSVSGRIPAPMLGAYHATKYALEAITDALRMELRPFGVAVVIVEPGTIRTEFAARAIKESETAQHGATRYAAIYARQAKLAASFDRIAAPATVVSRALVRAVEARRPRVRVVAPGRFVWMIALVKLLPVCWIDALMRRIAGLDHLTAT